MKPDPTLLAFSTLLILILLVTACSPGTPEAGQPVLVEASETPVPEPSPTATATPLPMPTATATPQGTKNIPYVTNGQPSQVLDIYLPETGAGPFPVVFALHGGNGDKGEFDAMGEYLSERGYALVAVNFRDMPGYKYPSGIQDAYCAFAWLQVNAATYEIDPQRVVVAGFSLGGTYAALMATVDDPSIYFKTCKHPMPDLTTIKGSVIYTGVFDYPAAVQGNTALKEYFRDFFGSYPDEKPERWQEASAVNWLDGSEQPFLLIHGDADGSVPPKNSQEFAARLKQFGIDVELVLVPGAQHMGIIYKRDLYESVETFIAPLLK